MLPNSRCLLLTLIVLVTLSKHGLALPGDQDAASTGGSETSSALSMRLLLEDPTDEAEGPSSEPKTFEYLNEKPPILCKRVERELCRIVEGQEECQIFETKECSGDATKRQFQCTAERKWSAKRLQGRLRNPIKVNSQLACCLSCQGVPNGECRSWWRKFGPDREFCYLNYNR